MTQPLDLDRCAAIRLEPSGEEVSLRVSLRDGRRAARRVAEPERLLEAVEALLILPSAPASEPPPSKADRPPVVDVERPSFAGAAAAANAIKPAHLELGLGAAGRIAGAAAPYGGAGFASFAQLSHRALVVDVTARYDIVDDTITQPSPSGFSMQTIGLGVGIGYRLESGAIDFDTVAGPQIIIEMQDAEGVFDGLGGRASDLRFDLLLRLSVPRQARTRFFAAADAEASPIRMRKAQSMNANLPALPSWSSGIAVGIMWSAL
jgi:hypothetical protein